MAAFMLKDAAVTGSSALQHAERCRAKAIEGKVEVVFRFANFINMTSVVGFFNTIILTSAMVAKILSRDSEAYKVLWASCKAAIL